jgi:hypothetical protein
MRKYLLILLLCIFSDRLVFANPGDTLVLQTFTFGSPQNAWFLFPSDTVRFEKILMKYTLKCNPAQNPACGEWDYLTYTYLFDHTGLTDSSLASQSMLLVNGVAQSSGSFINNPSYTYQPGYQNFITYLDTISYQSTVVGSPDNLMNNVFACNQQSGRSQFLWRASELLAAGMLPGNVSGLSVFVNQTGSMLQNLTIRIKQVMVDSLNATNVNGFGFMTVYQQHTQFPQTGINSLPFLNDFAWDGVSNLLVDISYDNSTTGIDNIIEGTATSYTSGLIKHETDRVASFNGNGYVSVPISNQITQLDSFITVSFWCFGDQALQPMDGTCFEAIDNSNNRILNVHLPWSNGQVYWDAGYSGTGYDRINTTAPDTSYKGKWNYWAFTKNVATGSMKIYLNGNLFFSGNAKTKPMSGINSFRIGKGHWGGSQTYKGKMDEFTVFNKELSQQSIQQLMHHAVNPSSPDYANLILYYNFNDGNYTSYQDLSSSASGNAFIFAESNPIKPAKEFNFGFSEIQQRPLISFSQGVFLSQVDSVFVLDSIQNPPVQVMLFNDSINFPGIATDTLLLWYPYYQYTFDSNGQVSDSTLIGPDINLTGGSYQYYNYFPQVIRYELARYITPYGIGLSLGDGWTWTFDVTDYRPLLADSVHLEAGNWQELLDLKFLLIKGTPPRDVVEIKNLWNGSFNYGQPNNSIENALTPKTLQLSPQAANTRWKSRITGHGMDTPQNCSEFCQKYHYFKLNGQQVYSRLVWRDNCDRNPLFPQGGTWVYDRSNWCPGAEVWTYDLELSDLVNPGSSITLDHDVQPYTSTGGWNYWQIEDQLISYSAPNFSLDASLEEILAPTTDQMQLRYNPICTNPKVVIKNTGSANLTSLTINYGLNGGPMSTYQWTGNLKFMDTATVNLGALTWVEGASFFTATISNPNGGQDQYLANNTRKSTFIYPTLLPETFVVEFKTNNYPWENSYTIKNNTGQVIAGRDGNMLSPNVTYRDTLTLPTGCYTFELIDTGEDGLSWWANSAQGSGFIRFRRINPSSNLLSWNADFGGQIYRQFTVGLTNSTEELFSSQNQGITVYPNPSLGVVYVDFDKKTGDFAHVEVFSPLGKLVYTDRIDLNQANSYRMDLQHLNAGIYSLRIFNNKFSKVVKLMIID